MKPWKRCCTTYGGHTSCRCVLGQLLYVLDDFLKSRALGPQYSTADSCVVRQAVQVFANTAQLLMLTMPPLLECPAYFLCQDTQHAFCVHTLAPCYAILCNITRGNHPMAHRLSRGRCHDRLTCDTSSA
jgi:hypothetical protein